jgi:hypothetical protein
VSRQACLHAIRHGKSRRCPPSDEHDANNNCHHESRSNGQSPASPKTSSLVATAVPTAPKRFIPRSNCDTLNFVKNCRGGKPWACNCGVPEIAGVFFDRSQPPNSLRSSDYRVTGGVMFRRTLSRCAALPRLVRPRGPRLSIRIRLPGPHVAPSVPVSKDAFMYRPV